jgi:hypothetical protein
MKDYLLAIYQPSDGTMPEPAALAEIMKNVDALNQEMKNAGVWVFSGGLTGPEAATQVQVRGNDVFMTDGPYTEGKEHIGGFVVIRVPDLDAALDWSRKLATVVTSLVIEVRPFAFRD